MGEHAGSSPSRHIPSGSPRPSHEWQRGPPRQGPDYESRHTPGVCSLPGIVVLPPSVRPSAGHCKATLLRAGGALLGKGCRFHDSRAAVNPFGAPSPLAALLESLSAGKGIPTGTPPRPGPNSPSAPQRSFPRRATAPTSLQFLPQLPSLQIWQEQGAEFGLVALNAKRHPAPRALGRSCHWR